MSPPAAGGEPPDGGVPGAGGEPPDGSAPAAGGEPPDGDAPATGEGPPGRTTPKARRRARLLSALLLLAAALLFGRLVPLPQELLARQNPPGAGPWTSPHPPGWLLPLDDAYIFVRYAQQAARGRPFQWNDGEPSTGASSFLFTFLLVPPHWAGGEAAQGRTRPSVEIPRAARGIPEGPEGADRGARDSGAAAPDPDRSMLALASRWSRWVGIASLGLLGLAAARLLRAAGLAEPWPLAGGLAVVWSGPVGFGAVAGMESAFNAALVLWTCALWTEALAFKHGKTEAGEGAIRQPLVPATRPEERSEERTSLPGGKRGSRLGGRGVSLGRKRTSPPGERVTSMLPLLAAGLLPLSRPENAALALAAALAVAVGLGPWRRRAALLPLLPGAALALLDLLLTGEAQPAGALAKSWLGTPFLPLGTLLRQYPFELAANLLPVYLGSSPALRPVLWPPVGLLAIGTALAALGAAVLGLRRGGTRSSRPFTPRDAQGLESVASAAGATVADTPGYGREPATGTPEPGPDSVPERGAGKKDGLGAASPGAPYRAGGDWRSRLATLAPLAIAWLLLFLLAPLSGVLLWQQMRHHHAGLACAWVLAVAGAALVLDPLLGRLGRRIRPLVLLLPLALLAALPLWAREHTRAAAGLYINHAAALAWLSDHARGQVLLLNDAGLLSLVHDGPAVDVMGLGTPGLTRTFRHGPGSIVEALARRRPLPQVAAIVPELFPLPELLGERLLPPPATPQGTLVARVRTELLRSTPLAGPGVDFADLDSERRGRVRWILPPGTQQPSFAFLLPGPGGRPELQGCRPLFGAVGFALPPGIASAHVRATLLPTPPAGIRIRGGDRNGPTGPSHGEAALISRSWVEMDVPGLAGAPYLWIERQGAGIPCVESVGLNRR